MAVFRVQVHYRLGVTGKWSNVWHVNTTDILNASVEFGLTAVPSLLALLHPDCVLDRLLTSNPANSDFIVNTINEFGTSADSGSRLPLFNSVKVIIPAPGFGRPDVKYLKGFLTETLVDDGELTPTTITGVDNQITAIIADMVAAGVPLCTDDGLGYTNVSVQAAIQMRQMHRKRRKTTAPA